MGKMRTSLAFIAIISIQIVVSRPPVSKYDLNTDLTDAQLSKLEPEKELDMGDREFAPSEGVGSHAAGKDSHEGGHKRHTEPNDADNEIDDVVDYGTGDYDHDYHNGDDDSDDDDDKKTNELKTVLTSFLMLVPKNSTMADLFNTVAQMLEKSSTNSTTDCPEEVSAR